ncbi:MAG: hypothetical protein HKN21_08735, partial [Candidatus Eisenbacteria bacterium]|nr:hypothetical protein [Candidatus Eisenbacteria bacterium]
KYRMDHHAKTYGRVPSLIREQVIHRGLEAMPRPLRRVRVAERSLAIQEPFERWASWFAGFAGPGRRNILAPSLLQELRDPSGREPIAAWFEESPNGNSLSQMLYADVKTWLADDLLMKMDRMSMATSLEARVPFLDHRLVEFAFTIPNEWKIKDGVGKWILRETFGPKLPSSILNRPKAGFPVPIDKWFRNDLKGFVESTLLSEQAASRGILNPQEVRRTVEDHVSGRRDNRREIWTLLNLELWFQVFIDPTHTPREAPEATALVS